MNIKNYNRSLTLMEFLVQLNDMDFCIVNGREKVYSFPYHKKSIPADTTLSAIYLKAEEYLRQHGAEKIEYTFECVDDINHTRYTKICVNTRI